MQEEYIPKLPVKGAPESGTGAWCGDGMDLQRADSRVAVPEERTGAAPVTQAAHMMVCDKEWAV